MPHNMDGASGGAVGGADKQFCNKPAKGWQYTDDELLNGGVTFNVRYVGCIEVKTSMKQLDFTMRSQVAKECISRVCESASLITKTKRRIDKRIDQCIDPQPRLDHAGCDVTLTVSSRSLSLLNLENNEYIANYDMPRISFASGGDSDTMDFVAFVAKDLQEWRACYVLECNGGQAQNLISTIGQAFVLRYNEYFNKTQDNENLNTHKEYYNDLPGKLPPELLDVADTTSQQQKKRHRERLSSNLIDLSSPPPVAPVHDYVNDESRNTTTTNRDPNRNGSPICIADAPRDVFDLHPSTLSGDVQRSQMQTEKWFHGVISRPMAEALLQRDGDFLVRESKAKPGQYVLTGLQTAVAKHLLLIDPEGLVRTKYRVFDSISHLINYHWNNALPIISEESALVLRHPVVKNATEGSRPVKGGSKN